MTLQAYAEQVKHLWDKLPVRGRWLIALAGVVILAGLITLALGGRSEEMAVAFAELEPRDAAAIVSLLDEQGVRYRITEGGTAIEVPPDAVYKVRLQSAAQGLPAQGVVGLEVMESLPLGATDFDRRVQYLRGLQGELARSILQIEGVRGARVHLNIPEPSLFIRDERPATAAVLVDLAPGAIMAPETVQAIQHLVAFSVEDMKVEDVAVIDRDGRDLSDPGMPVFGAGASGPAAVEASRQFAREIERGLVTLLEPALGNGNVQVRVSAELDMDERTIERNSLDPPAGIPVTEKTATERFTGEGGVPAAAAGVESNLPGGFALGQFQVGNGTLEREQAEREFAVGQLREQVRVAPGSVRRLSVAVLVNGELSPEQQAEISRTVTAAVGLSAVRGDQVEVVALPFARNVPATTEGETGRAPVPRLLEVGLASAVVVLAVAVWWFLVRRRRQPQEVAAEETAGGLLDVVSLPVERKSAEPEQEALRSRLVAMSRQRPDEVARLLRSWLAERN